MSWFVTDTPCQGLAVRSEFQGPPQNLYALQQWRNDGDCPEEGNQLLCSAVSVSVDQEFPAVTEDGCWWVHRDGEVSHSKEET